MSLFRAIRSLPLTVRQSSLARNALWISAGQVVSLVVQALSFVLLARLLGSKEYGILAGAVAFVSLFSQYTVVSCNVRNRFGRRGDALSSFCFEFHKSHAGSDRSRIRLLLPADFYHDGSGFPGL